MNVLTFETCWAVNSEIKKQVTSSWSIFIQLSILNTLNTLKTVIALPIHSLSFPLEIFPFTQSSYLKALPHLEPSFTFVFLITAESNSCVVTSGSCSNDWLLLSERTGYNSIALHLPNDLKPREYFYHFISLSPSYRLWLNVKSLLFALRTALCLVC